MDTKTDIMMDSIVCVKPGRMALERRPRPSGGPEGWVLIDIAAIGICGTDYHIFEGKHPFLDYPRVIGHELSGHIASGPDTGKLVVVNPYVSCGACRACRRGKPNCCSAISVLGVHRDRRACAPASPCRPKTSIRPMTSRRNRLPWSSFWQSAHTRVARSGAGAGDVVLVTGAGPIGIGVALFARLAGADVHIRDLSEARLDLARDLFGFDKTPQARRYSSRSATFPRGSTSSSMPRATASAIEAGFSAARPWRKHRSGQRGEGQHHLRGFRIPQARGTYHRLAQRTGKPISSK